MELLLRLRLLLVGVLRLVVPLLLRRRRRLLRPNLLLCWWFCGLRLR